MPRRDLPRLLLTLALLVAFTAAVYWPATRHGFVNFDDEDYVYGNPAVREGLSARTLLWSLGATHAGNWHPLTWVSLGLDVTLFGVRPGGHVLVNILLHCAGSALLLLALRGLTGALGRSAAVAALFALHPLHVESVAWISERKDVLSGVFWMLVLLAYRWHLRRPQPARYALLVATYALGLTAKPMLVSLPVVLLLLDYWPLGRLSGRDRARGLRRALREKIPLFALAAVSAAVTFLVQRQAQYMRTLEEYDFGSRLGNAVLGYGWYLLKTAWPSGLAALYPFGEPEAWRAGLTLVVLALITAAALRLARRLPALAVGWLWYLVVLLPVIGLVQVGFQATADRYSYLPLIGVFLAAAWGIHAAVGPERARAAAAAAATVLLLGGLAVGARRQVGYWRDSVTLFTRVIEVTGGNSLAFTKLGVGLVGARRYAEAEAALREAIRLDPRNAPARFNLALLALSLGDLESARGAQARLRDLDPELAARLEAFLGAGARPGSR